MLLSTFSSIKTQLTVQGIQGIERKQAFLRLFSHSLLAWGMKYGFPISIAIQNRVSHVTNCTNNILKGNISIMQKSFTTT